MRKYVLESAKLLKSSPVKHQNKKPNVEVLNKNKKILIWIDKSKKKTLILNEQRKFFYKKCFFFII